MAHLWKNVLNKYNKENENKVSTKRRKLHIINLFTRNKKFLDNNSSQIEQMRNALIMIINVC